MYMYFLRMEMQCLHIPTARLISNLKLDIIIDDLPIAALKLGLLLHEDSACLGKSKCLKLFLIRVRSLYWSLYYYWSLYRTLYYSNGYTITGKSLIQLYSNPTRNLLNFKHFTGIYSLIHDNTTENGRTINIFKRFNIFQEVVLAALYRLLSLKVCSLKNKCGK